MRNTPINIAELKRSLLNDLSKLFSGNEAYSITRLILEHFDYSEFSILKDPTAKINSKLQAEIKKIVNELNKNRPIQYILGETMFCDLRFLVNESVLIPRPETEELITKILAEYSKPDPKIIDIGCGSGCISVALAHRIPASKVYGIDIDSEAIITAKKNAELNNTKVEFIQKSIFEIVAGKDVDVCDIIVSNPPYVTQAERSFMLPNVTKYEPEQALFVPDNDPLIFYREILRFAEKGLSESGVIWVEINEKFGDELVILFQKSNYKSIRLIKDIHGKERFIKAMK